ncbi:hypothetical protein LDENG_00133800 [Lucifuga dentata]|nr:hypothetical protein LDENG_00133800 [Lucifuga dentata]
MEESAVKVCVRVRPVIQREENAAEDMPVQLYWKADKKSVQQIDDSTSTKSFSFGTIFAYGQTSSGKTFTMMGSDHTPGVIPLAVEDVFKTIKTCPKKEFLLRVSYMEIYNETVTDLLVDSWKRKPLEIRETINKNIFVADLTEELVTSSAQALAWIRKGEKNRRYGKTKMNQRSSRSHTIFRMILESREMSDPASGENADGAIIVSHLNLVDLAGSERASQTGAEGARFKEGCNINRSLFTLSQVIKKLTDEGQKGFTNYRDSKLTRILQNSLGGNAKTVIICTITPVVADETLSTLQFASTAKKMKNDPHVTEVSDDGALLKRYRNEIVDLKRRLQEVSSVTQTTATEKEVLSQLLQEKDQLQKEQEDRIRNLTKLLVTSSNLVPVHRMPKRRVTWGGKMLKLAQASACDDFQSNLSFAESFAQRRKPDCSSMTVLAEDDEDFDSQWEIPDEPSDDMEMSQASVTVRSFGDSPKDLPYPDQMHELSGKVSNLEMQLEMEIQQKEEAVAKAETLDCRIAALELQLKAEARQKQEALQQMETTEQRANELVLHLQTEAQQKQEAAEKTEMLEIRVADLERYLEEQTAADDKMRKDLEEAIQLCVTLASEKEMVAAERESLKKELESFISQTERLQKEKADLSKELEEKKELDVFTALEQELSKTEMQNEIASLKKDAESSRLKCLELEKKLGTVSEELRKKTDLAEELQKMSGKDLVQEVATLRRSLDDAEGLSRDTKREWAFLRSQNIALEEMNASLTSSHGKMEAEVNSLRCQIEAEKSRYKKMQSDLQKELNVAFDENTKLTSLLDGRVPKHLMDSMELERSVAKLNKELVESRDAEEILRAQLVPLQNLPEKVNNLLKQVNELTEELCAIQTQRDALLSTQTDVQEETQQLRDALQAAQQEILKTQEELNAAALREKDLRQRCVEATERLDSLRSDLERSHAEKSHLTASVEESGQSLDESERQRASLEDRLSETQKLMQDLEEKLADSEVSRTTEEEISKELQEQMDQLTEELRCLRAERNEFLSEEKETLLSSLTAERNQLSIHLQQNAQMLNQLNEELQSVKAERDTLSAGHQTSHEEMEKLLSAATALTAERDQLKLDLQENVEMMIENQEELRSALEKNREQKEQIKRLETQLSKQDDRNKEKCVEELQNQMKTLAEELQLVRAERDGFLSERTAGAQTEETETLLSKVNSLSEERDQLQEILEGLRQEKQQLRAELQDRMETVQQLNSEQLSVKAEQEAQQLLQIQQLEEQLETSKQEVIQLKTDLQENVELMIENQEELRISQEKIKALKEEIIVLRNQKEEVQSQASSGNDAETAVQIRELQNQIERLTSDLECVKAERDGLRSDASSVRTSSEETEKLLSKVNSLSEERDQLQEKQQLRAELQDRMETLQTEMTRLQSSLQTVTEQKSRLENNLQQNLETMRTLTEKLQCVEAERDGLRSEKEASVQTSSEETEKLLSKVNSLSEERDQLQEKLEVLRQEKQQLRAELQDRMETFQTEMTRLQSSLQTVTEQKSRLENNLQQNLETVSTTQSLLKAAEEELQEQKQMISDLEKRNQEKEFSLDQQMRTLTEKLQCVEAERDGSQRPDVLRGDREAAVQSEFSERGERPAAGEAGGPEAGEAAAQSGAAGDQLQEKLEVLRQEKQQLRAELQGRMETVEQLEEELQTLKHAKAEAGASQQLLSEANATISVLREQLSQSANANKEAKTGELSSRLQDSTCTFQESFKKFQEFIDMCSKYNTESLDKVIGTKQLDLSTLPKSTMEVYSTLCNVQQQMVRSLGNYNENLQKFAQGCMNVFEELVKKDVAVFEERRLQDVLLCRAQASSYSVKDEDLQTLWEHRLSELLDKRQIYLQKMSSTLEKLEENKAAFSNQLLADLREREGFKDQLLVVCNTTPVNYKELDSILSRELVRRSAQGDSRDRTFQSIASEREGLFEELKTLESQTDSLLRDERSKSATLLQTLEGAPLKTEIDLLKDNKQLVLELQQSEEKLKALRVQIEQLEDAQTKTNSRLSNHKQATQLLQTELQDARAQVSEKENAIQSLTRKLRQSEKNASPDTAELETLRAKVFKMEVALTSASSEHQEEIRRLNTLLSDKEESLRKLKEVLRTTQQQGEESFLQGKDLHARLTNPRGLLVKSSICLEKAKLEEEVKQLHAKINELESSVSSLQVEVSKWKSRAFKLKGKNKGHVDKPPSLSPCTPTKRGFSMTSDASSLFSSPKRFLGTPKKMLDSPKKMLDSPKKLRDSPKVSLPSSPKSSFFGTGSEMLSRNYPKHFFDNSSLGLNPGAERNESWPDSPKQEDLCRTQ